MQDFNTFLARLKEYFKDLQDNDKNLVKPKWFNDYKVLDNINDVKQKILEIYMTAGDCKTRSLSKEMLDFIATFQKCSYVRNKKYADFKVENAVREEGILKRLDDKQRILSDNVKG